MPRLGVGKVIKLRARRHYGRIRGAPREKGAQEVVQ